MRGWMCGIGVAAVTAFMAVACIEAGAKTVDEHLYLIPAGSVDADTLGYLKREIPGLVPVEIKVAVEAPRPVPDTAYDAARQAYDAAAIVTAIARSFRLALVTERGVIVTDAAIFVPGTGASAFNYIDGKKGMAVVSLFALGRAPGSVRARALRQTVSALAGMRGVGACAKPECVMAPSADLASIDRQKGGFCRECRRNLQKRYGSPLIKTPFL